MVRSRKNVQREGRGLTGSLQHAVILLTAGVLASAACLSAQHSSIRKTNPSFRPLPAAWAGDWDGVDSLDTIPASAKGMKDEPAHEAIDPLIKGLLTPWAQTRMQATSYDDAPGSLCDPEGWFPFINYGYGFALLASAQKITMVPVEADTEGIRRVYLKPAHAEKLTPSWDGDSIAHWEGETLVIDTTGFNDQSWLGDDREPHTTQLHMVERMRLLRGGNFLQVETEIADPQALRTPYKMTRYFMRYQASHLAAGPDRDTMELVCNEDPSPFLKQEKKATAAAPSSNP